MIIYYNIIEVCSLNEDTCGCEIISYVSVMLVGVYKVCVSVCVSVCV